LRTAGWVIPICNTGGGEDAALRALLVTGLAGGLAAALVAKVATSAALAPMVAANRIERAEVGPRAIHCIAVPKPEERPEEPIRRVKISPNIVALTDIACPMPLATAAPFGCAHFKAIAAQSMTGLHRTLPAWAVVGTIVLAIDGRRRRPTPTDGLRVIALSAALQMMWTTGFAVVSSTRTVVRLKRLTNDQMLPVRIDSADESTVYACAHLQPVRSTLYVDGVFAWPRQRGGGRVITRKLCSVADGRGVTLTLTALSPRIAAKYRRIGFRDIAWIYLMRREPGAEAYS